MAGEIQPHNPSAERSGEPPKRRKRRGEASAAEPAAKAKNALPALNLALESLLKQPREESKAAKSPKPKIEYASHEPEEAGPLSRGEAAEATNRLIAERARALEGELAAASPDEAHAIEAGADYLAEVQRRVQTGEEPAQAMDEAYVAATGEPAELPAAQEEVQPAAGEAEVEVPLHAEGSEAQTDAPVAEAADAPSASTSTDSEFLTRDRPSSVPGAAPVGPAAAPDYRSAWQRSAEAAAVAAGTVVGVIAGVLLASRLRNKQAKANTAAVQRAVERQVRQLHDQLVARETAVRKVADERSRAALAAQEAAAANRLQAAAEQVKSAQARPEKRTPAERTAIPDIEQLPLKDVLKISDRITIGATSVSKVFETNLVSERGLRRIVKEHLRGGDVRRVLAQELMIKEIGHELDPLLRDRTPEDRQAKPASGGRGETREPAAKAAPSPAAQPATAPSSAQPSRPEPVPSSLIIANIVAAFVLIAALATLLIVWWTR